MYLWNDDELNKEQEVAILEENNILLIACPGSGKTRTLTYKIAYELTRLKSKKEYVIAITYTNRAADEIKERIDHLGIDTTQLWIGTIHSFCLDWILKPYCLHIEELKEGFNIINSHDSERLLTELCLPYKNPKVTYYDCGFWATPRRYEINSLSATKRPIVERIISEYFEILKRNKQIDFEQILFYSYKILQKKKLINEILSKLFAHILIDEYQDTKEIQYCIICNILKAGKGRTKTLIVGDPNQSIYQTLGGFPMDKKDIETLSNLNIKELSLSANYRSSSRIINYFDHFKIYKSNIYPASRTKDYNSLITYNTSVLKDKLEDEIAKLILYNVRELNIDPTEICIVAPQWVHLASLTRNLMTKLPDFSFDGPGMAPFSRDLENFWYKVSRIILTEPSPSLYVRRIRWSRDILNELSHIGIDVSNLTPKKFLRICNSIDIDEEDGLTYLQEAFNSLFEALNISFSIYPMLSEHYTCFFESSQKRIDRIKKEGSEFISHIDTFRKVFKQKGGITISTIHGIKGAEYDTMIAYALLEDFVPHFNDSDGYNNAQKLLYVIASRARKNLHLISESNRINGRGETYIPTGQLYSYKFEYDELFI